MATLLLSQGVPMIRAGDELSQSQRGNNNAYCQDNEISWLSWQLNDAQKGFVDFVSGLLKLRREQPVLRRRNYFQGLPIRGSRIKEISWLEPSGQEMTDEAWNSARVPCIGVRLAGDVINEVDERGEPVTGDTLLLLLNPYADATPFTLPRNASGTRWEVLSDTARPGAEGSTFAANEAYPLHGQSMAVLCVRRQEPESSG